MSKRKVEFAEEVLFSEQKGVKKRSTEEVSRRFKENHSLDSDEEYDVEEEKLDEDDIEGQEEGTVDYDEGIKITPFNMKEELEEGHFDKHGTFIFNSDKDEIHDAWMDNIDWQKIKERQDPSKIDDDQDSDSEPEHADLKEVYRKMLNYIQPGETVAKALRRLGGNKKGKKQSSADKWKAKKQKKEENEEDNKEADDKKKFLELTELADKLLQEGNMDAYELTYEKLNYEITKVQNGADRLKVLEGTNDDDALDMFAEDFDNKEAKKIKKDFQNSGNVTNTEKTDDGNKGGTESNEVMWEYRWKDEDSEEVHGPYSSSQMLEWSEEGFFKSGVFCRKVGTQSQFYSSRRIDFDLYT